MQGTRELPDSSSPGLLRSSLRFLMSIRGRIPLVDTIDLAKDPLLLGIAACAALLLAMPFIVTPGVIYPAIVGKTLFARALVEIMTALWVILAWNDRRYRPNRSFVMLSFLAFVGVAGIAAITGVSPVKSLWSSFPRMMGVWGLAHWYLLALILASTIRTPKGWWWLLNGCLLSVLLLSAIGVLQSFGLARLPGTSSDARISATLGNPSYLAAILVLAIPPAASFLVRSAEARQKGIGLALLRIFWATTVILGIWVLFLTGTRAAVVGLVGGAVVMPVGALVSRANGALKPAAWAAAIILFTVAVVFLVDRTMALPTRLPTGEQSVSARFFPAPSNNPDSSIHGHLKASMASRILSARYGLRAFARRPLLGWGPENYLPAFEKNLDRDYFRTADDFFDQAHNVAVEELATKGILGGLTFAALWIAIAWVILRHRRSTREQIIACGVLGALTAYLVQAQFLFDTPTAMLFWTILVAWVAGQENCQKATAPAGNTSGTGRLCFPGSGRVLIAAGLAAALVLGISLATFSYRPYRAAADAGFALAAKQLDAAALDQAQHGFHAFPAMANEGRALLFQRLTQEWPTMDDNTRRQAAALALVEIDQGVAAEPANTRFLLSAILFLQTSATSQEDLARSDALLDRLVRAAPERVQVHQFLAVQALLKNDPYGATMIADNYEREAPWTARYFSDIRAVAHEMTPASSS